MSISNLISGITGAIAGFFIGGGPMGAVYGFSIGFGLSLAADALAPDMPSPGQPQMSELNYPSADEGAVIYDALGTVKSTGNIFHVFGNRTVELTEEVGGKGGGGGEEVTTGYNYYLSLAMGICIGPVDKLYSIWAGEDLAWSGNLERPTDGLYTLIELSAGELIATTVPVTNEVWANTFDGPVDAEGAVDGGYQYVKQIVPVENYDYTINSYFITPPVVNPLASVDDYGGVIESGYVILKARYTFEGAVGGSEYVDLGTETYIRHSWDDTNKVFRLVVANKFPEAPSTTYSWYLGIGYFDKLVFFIYHTGTKEVVVSDTRSSMGNAWVYWGTETQEINPKMLADKPDTPAYRHLFYIFFDDVFIGNYNRFPAIKVVYGKYPQLSFNANETIQDFDYNPSHAIWQIMTNQFHSNLPVVYMDAVTFSAGANVLYGEGRGVGILFDRQQTALAYISTILEHVGGIMRYSGSGDLKDE